MLYFYLLGDDQYVSSYTEEVGPELVGRIDHLVFESLKRNKILPERFDYHSDFRWDLALDQLIGGNIES